MTSIVFFNIKNSQTWNVLQLRRVPLEEFHNNMDSQDEKK